MVVYKLWLFRISEPSLNADINKFGPTAGSYGKKHAAQDKKLFWPTNTGQQVTRYHPGRSMSLPDPSRLLYLLY
jgi:hypothetical protein